MKTLQAFAIACCLAGSAAAQENPPARVIVPPDPGFPPSQDYRIGPSDIVSVYIIKMPELSREYQVTAEGTIELPFLGSFKVQQKSASELSTIIANKLRGDFLVDPQVSVSVKPTVITRRFFVQGAVRAPGVYNLEARPSLLELISVAGGLNETYGATAFIIHKAPLPKADATGETDSEPQVQYELRKANLNALLRGEFAENLRIEPEDIVQIPAADVFFVAGDVKAPGSFALREGSTLRQAISLAQGTTPTASPARAIIFREDANGQKREIPVDVRAVMRGRKPDMPILANDIIVIPNSRTKSIFVPVVNAFGVNAAWAATRVIAP